MICKFSLIYFGNGLHTLFERQRFKTGIYHQGGGGTGATDMPPFFDSKQFQSYVYNRYVQIMEENAPPLGG